MGKIFKDCKQCGARYLTCHCEVVSKEDLRKLVERMRKRGDLITEVWADELEKLIGGDAIEQDK